MKKWVGLILTLAALVVAAAAPWLVTHDPLTADFVASLKPPGTPGHPLGTDQLGRDLLARVLYGARLAVFIGACTVVVTAVAGGLLGLLAGSVERWPSAVVMRIADVQLSFPFILLALTINAIVGLGLRNIILSLSAAGWVVYARVVRAEVLAVKQRDFVQAAAALGVGRLRACCSVTCCPTSRPRSSWWPAYSSRSSSWPRPPSAFSASACSRPRRRGAAC